MKIWILMTICTEHIVEFHLFGARWFVGVEMDAKIHHILLYIIITIPSSNYICWLKNLTKDT